MRYTLAAGPGRAAIPGRAIDGLIVFALAFTARVAVALTSGGLQGNYGYDAGVYYSAADALVHGRLPYRDFVFLHPPGIILALTPFAWFGQLTSDHAGFVAATLAFTALGALNAVLVVRIATSMDLGRWPAFIGGSFYALWFGSVQSEYLTRLEPLGNFFLLCGLLAYLRAQRTGRTYLAGVGGLALGAAAGVKIWWVVPLLVVLAWQLLARSPVRQVVLTAVGAGAALLIINGSFFLTAPRDMWTMVVTEQLGRHHDSNSIGARLRSITDLNRVPHLHGLLTVGSLLLLGVLVLGLCAVAWTVPWARLVVVLAVVQLAVLVTAPSWFPFYSDFLAPTAALLVATSCGAAAGAGSKISPIRATQRAARWVWVPVAAAGLLTASILALHPGKTVQPFPGDQLARDVAHLRCVQADSPIALIELNALSRDFANGCAVWVDVTGLTYGVDAAPRRPNGSSVPRAANVKWQRDLRAYLLSGQAVIIVRAEGTGLSRSTQAAVQAGGVLASAAGVVVYRTRR